jgi:hypothetical protein
MTGTLIVYHRPMRRINFKNYNYTISTTLKEKIKQKRKNIQSKYKNMNVLMITSSHKNSKKKERSQFSITFVLSSHYRSHSVLLDNAVQCCHITITSTEIYWQRHGIHQEGVLT